MIGPWSRSGGRAGDNWLVKLYTPEPSIVTLGADVTGAVSCWTGGVGCCRTTAGRSESAVEGDVRRDTAGDDEAGSEAASEAKLAVPVSRLSSCDDTLSALVMDGGEVGSGAVVEDTGGGLRW